METMVEDAGPPLFSFNAAGQRIDGVVGSCGKQCAVRVRFQMLSIQTYHPNPPPAPPSQIKFKPPRQPPKPPSKSERQRQEEILPAKRKVVPRDEGKRKAHCFKLQGAAARGDVSEEEEEGEEGVEGVEEED